MPNRGRESEGVLQIRFSSPFLARKGGRGMVESVLKDAAKGQYGRIRQHHAWGVRRVVRGPGQSDEITHVL